LTGFEPEFSLGFNPAECPERTEVSAMPQEKASKQKITFTFKAPDARAVLLVGDFTGWIDAPLSLKKDKDGTWKKVVSLPPGSYQYRLMVDGEWRDDPNCPNRHPNQFGGTNCVCIVDNAPST
jgi:5'-AMP-activated protein kinase regulatory beta subunit